MSVIKVVDLVGTSSEGWEQATRSVVEEASKTIKNIESVDVTNMSAMVEDGEIVEWQVDTRVAFRIEQNLREEHHEHHTQQEKMRM
jgi:dodecin